MLSLSSADEANATEAVCHTVTAFQELVLDVSKVLSFWSVAKEELCLAFSSGDGENVPDREQLSCF